MNILLYIILCLVWGSTWLAIKIGLSQAPPITTAALRFVLAMIVLSGISLVKGYRYPRDVRTILSLAWPGLFMYGVSYALVYLAEQHIDSATAAVLFGAYPFFVAALSWLLYRSEKLSGLGWLGMLIGFAGVVLISYDSLQVSSQLFVGSLLAVAAPLAAAYGIVVHKQKHTDENIVVAVNVQMAAGGLFLIVWALLFESWSDFHPSAEAVGSIVYLALFGTVLTFLAYYWLVARLPVVSVSLIAFITPLVAVLIGLAAADERLTLFLAIGTALILSGVLLVIRKAPAASSGS
jgi:drug/metabolite transporter (DMT)-like permease